MEAQVIVTTELQLKAFIADAVSAAFKYYQPPAAAIADEVLTIEQAAEFLHLSTQTIYGLVSDRKIPFSKPTGSRLYFSRLELIDWLGSHRTGTVQEKAQQYDQSRVARRTRATSKPGKSA